MTTILKVMQGAISVDCSEIEEIRLKAYPTVARSMGVSCKTVGRASLLPIAAFMGEYAMEDAVAFKSELEAAIQKLNKAGGGTIETGLLPGDLMIKIIRNPRAGR